MNNSDEQYNWEQDYTKSWSALQDKKFLGGVDFEEFQKKLQRKSYLDEINASLSRRSMIRYFILIIDMSDSMKCMDLRPNRLTLTKSFVADFIKDFFDENPLSQLALIMTKNGKSYLVSDFVEPPKEHVDRLEANSTIEGDPSLQNALELAMQNFKTIPSYAQKEILIIMSSLTTCDPGNIYETVDSLASNKVKCSILSLSAAVFIFEYIAGMTNGEFVLVTSESQYKELLRRFLFPNHTGSNTSKNTLIRMGFPLKQISRVPALCACHNELRCIWFQCPRCLTKQCEIPSFCKVCNLMLVSSAHLTRTAHHNLPIANYNSLSNYLSESTEFENVNLTSIDQNTMHKIADIIKINKDKFIESIFHSDNEIGFICNGCNKKLNGSLDKDNLMSISICMHCKCLYCIDCDVFNHETLLSCPTCS